MAEHGEIRLLDHGYIRLVEHWGSDEKIVEAARMSTGKGFLGWGDEGKCARCGERDPDRKGGRCQNVPGSDHDWQMYVGDEKLLRYLYKNRHDTPFEMAGMTVEVQAPIFVFREWHRHRVPWCLAGDTEVTCLKANGEDTYRRTIRDIYELKYKGVVDRLGERSWLDPEGRTANGYSRTGKPVTRLRRLKVETARTRTRLLPSCQERTLRVLDESNEVFVAGRMADVFETGVKEVWRVETAKGQSLKTSADHRFYTREGWKRASELRLGDMLATNGLVPAMERPYPPALRSGIGVWTSMMRSRLIADEDRCYVCGDVFDYDDLVLDHVVPVVLDLRKALDEENLKPICQRCHRAKTNAEQVHRQSKMRLGLRWVALACRPRCVGEEMTYDIEVEGPHHNFVANGVVVHNSYNEASARYAPLPDLNYIPTLERLMRGGGHLTKQAGQAAGAQALTEAAAERFRHALRVGYDALETGYRAALADGVPKELARVLLPVGRYSKMRASSNLRGWFHFFGLRRAKNAQEEIRVYADAAFGVASNLFPRSCALFAEGFKG